MITDIERLIEEVVPELKATEPPKKISFWRSLWTVASHCDGDGGAKITIGTLFASLGIASVVGMIEALLIGLVKSDFIANIHWGNTICAGLLVGFFLPLLSMAVFSDSRGSVTKRTFSVYVGTILLIACLSSPLLLLPITIPLAAWVIEAKRLADPANWYVAPKPESLPSFEKVHSRLLERMKKEIEMAKKKVLGPDSEIERRIAELKQKRNEAARIATHFNNRMKGLDTQGREYRDFHQHWMDAVETRDLFNKDIEALEGEQQSVLNLFNEIEAFVPAEEARIADDKAIEDLRRLRGEAVESRTISREMLMASVEPVVQKLTALNVARERLLSHSISALRPISLDSFIRSTEEAAESVVALDSTLRKVQSRSGEVVS